MSAVLISIGLFLIFIEIVIVAIGGIKLLKLYNDHRRTSVPLQYLGIEGPLVLIIIGFIAINWTLKILLPN